MLVHATVEKMTAMHLTAMAEAFQHQLTSVQFADLSFEDRVGMLIDQEWTAREQRKLQRRLQVANLRHQASLEDIDWLAPRRGLDKTLVGSLATCGLDPAAPESRHHRADRNRQVVAGRRLCRADLPRRVLRLPRAHSPGAARPRRRPRGRLLHAAAGQAGEDRPTRDGRLGAGPPHRAATPRCPRVLEDRTERASTLITTQLPIKAWHEAIGDPTLADAICDRLVHTAHVLDLQGPSMRDPKVRAQRGHPDPRPAEPGRAPTKPTGSARKEAKRSDRQHGS